jgi:hypothetical protein
MSCCQEFQHKELIGIEAMFPMEIGRSRRALAAATFLSTPSSIREDR